MNSDKLVPIEVTVEDKLVMALDYSIIAADKRHLGVSFGDKNCNFHLDFHYSQVSDKLDVMLEDTGDFDRKQLKKDRLVTVDDFVVTV